MNEKAPAVYFKETVWPLVDSSCQTLEEYNFGMGLVAMTLADPKTIDTGNDVYEKWFNEWNENSEKLYEISKSLCDLRNRLKGIMNSLDSDSVKWIETESDEQVAG